MAAFTDGNMRASQIFAANSMKITKLKVKKGQKISKGCLLCFYKDDNDTLQRFKSHEIGTITDVFVKDGDNVDKGTALFAWEGCNHPTVMKDMCADCGADLRVENSTAGNRKEEVSASVAMVHSIPELIVSEQYAKELGKADEERLLKTRKLVLLVDLDQTLIHTTNDNIPANLKDVHHYQLWHGKQLLWYHTRLRPHTQSFLEKISTLFELHICTFGSRIYAHTIAKIIDPEGKYFSHRILSRDECFNAQAKTANLKALFPNGDSMVCIIDDREDVWHFSPNLIHVKPYRFFQGTADINAPPGLTKTEQDSEPMVHRVRKVSVSSTGSNEDKSETDKSEKSEEKNEGKSNDSKNDPTVEDKVSDLKDRKTRENNKEDNDSNESNSNGDNEKSESPMEVEGEGDLKTEVSVSDGPIETEGVDKTEDKESDKNSDSNIVDSCKGGSENNEKQIVDDSAVKDDLSDKKSVESEAENKNDVDKKCSGDKAIDKKGETNDQEEELIEWDDEDDYLLHLEEILKNIHSTFYKFQDDFVKKQSDKSDNIDKTNVDDDTAPSLKNLIPYIKKKVLKGCNLVFSGVIPTNMTPEKSRAYIVAKSLGATVQTDFRTKENEKDPKNFTTHLVAARAGTQKVRTAMKYKHINKVNADWLWSCVERWERVEEVLFPLTALLECEQGRDSPDIIEQQKKATSKRKRPYDSDSDKNKSESKRSKQNGRDDDNDENTDDADNESDKKPDNFAMSYNPMLAFSDDDLAYMDKEVENELESDDDDASSEEDDVREERIRNQVLKKVPELVESSSEDSLCADLPRGWGLRKKMSPRSSSDDEKKGSDSPERVDISPEYESETDQDKFEKIMDAFGPESENTDDDEYAESVGSVDEEIAEAVMKEFLS